MMMQAAATLVELIVAPVLRHVYTAGPMQFVSLLG